MPTLLKEMIKGASISPRARQRMNVQTSPGQKIRMSNAPDPFQKQAVFTAAEPIGGWKMCRNGMMR